MHVHTGNVKAQGRMHTSRYIHSLQINEHHKNIKIDLLKYDNLINYQTKKFGLVI